MISDMILKQYKHNALIFRDEIGKSRPVGYPVPKEKIFGKPSYQENRQSCQEVLNNWQDAQGTQSSRPQRDYISMNRLQAKECETQPAYSFRELNPVCKQRREGSLDVKITLPDQGFVYGKPNWKNMEMKKIVEHQYQQQADQELLKRYLDIEKKKARVMKDKDEIRSRSHNNKHMSLNTLTQNKEPFKMKKFRNIDSKYKQQDNPIDWTDILNSH